MTTESPPIDDADGLAYRRAMGAFATGVCVVTATGPDGPVGMTINSVTSVSLNPRLLLWCLDLESERARAFLEAETFSIHVLGADDAALADRFSRGESRLTEQEALTGATDAPVLRHGVARLDCVLHERVPMGDHLILVGRVDHFEARGGDGLTFFRGRYGRIQEGVT